MRRAMLVRHIESAMLTSVLASQQAGQGPKAYEYQQIWRSDYFWWGGHFI